MTVANKTAQGAFGALVGGECQLWVGTPKNPTRSDGVLWGDCPWHPPPGGWHPTNHNPVPVLLSGHGAPWHGASTVHSNDHSPGDTTRHVQSFWEVFIVAKEMVTVIV